jgi:hypothetical protein
MTARTPGTKGRYRQGNPKSFHITRTFHHIEYLLSDQHLLSGQAIRLYFMKKSAKNLNLEFTGKFAF